MTNKLICEHKFEHLLVPKHIDDGVAIGTQNSGFMKCSKCGIESRDFDVDEYLASKKAINPNNHDISKNEQIWLNVVNSCLQGGVYVSRCDSSYVQTATTFADEVLLHHARRLRRGEFV